MSGPLAHQRDQFDQQRDARLAQHGEKIRRLDRLGQRRLLQQEGDRGAHQALLRRRRPREGRIERALRRRVRAGGARADAGEFGQALLHQVAEGAVGNLRQLRLRALGQARLALQRVEVHVLADAR